MYNPHLMVPAIAVDCELIPEHRVTILCTPSSLYTVYAHHRSAWPSLTGGQSCIAYYRVTDRWFCWFWAGFLVGHIGKARARRSLGASGRAGYRLPWRRVHHRWEGGGGVDRR